MAADAEAVCVPGAGRVSQHGTHEDTQTRSTAWACTGNNTGTRCFGTDVRNSKLAVTPPASTYACM
eukprot:4454500-Prymnesium_polylepis.1